MNQIEIYKSADNEIELQVNLDVDTVWLSQKQMADLFDRNRVAITQHIGNIFKERELVKKSVCKDFLHTAGDGKKYKTTFYNLDVIISVGYRVNSKRGTQFRQWATQRLKDHLVKGYTINQKRLEQLQQTIQLIEKSGKTETLSLSEAKGLPEIISNYTQSFVLLNRFDSQTLEAGKLNENITYEIEYK